MKIPLNFRGEEPHSAAGTIAEADILAAREGDWNAKSNLARLFMPLITSLAHKRADEPAAVNKYIEAGKQGLAEATRHYKKTIGAQRFRIFAVDYIEKAMDKAGGGGRGLLARLFGR